MQTFKKQLIIYILDLNSETEDLNQLNLSGRRYRIKIFPFMLKASQKGLIQYKLRE